VSDKKLSVVATTPKLIKLVDASVPETTNRVNHKMETATTVNPSLATNITISIVTRVPGSEKVIFATT
jgi:phage terminase large subunit-like protein